MATVWTIRALATLVARPTAGRAWDLVHLLCLRRWLGGLDEGEGMPFLSLVVFWLWVTQAMAFWVSSSPSCLFKHRSAVVCLQTAPHFQVKEDLPDGLEGLEEGRIAEDCAL